ncbi:hypothetical protein PO909_002237 [Leuciscus waleckii]
MTSLGGQFSAKRLGDSPFSIRTEGTLITGSSARPPVLTICMSNSSCDIWKVSFYGIFNEVNGGFHVGL